MFERPKPSEIPDQPGAYFFRDKHGKVIYVGKAKSLRGRVASYFGVGLHPRTQAMVDNAQSVEWIITESEVAAVMLEFSLIKRHRPRFNIKLVDDKSYPYLAITRSDEWPRARVMRREAERQRVLRALCPHLCHPQDPRPVAAHLPGPHLHRFTVRPSACPGPPLPSLPHRKMLRSLHRRRRPGGLSADGRRVSRVPPGGHRAGVDRSPGPDVGGVGASGIRARRPASGSDR